MNRQPPPIVQQRITQSEDRDGLIERLVGSVATCAAMAAANGRWAQEEHRRAVALIEASKTVVEHLACNHDFDPECGRCAWMTPFRRAFAEALRDAKADTKTERAEHEGSRGGR